MPTLVKNTLNGKNTLVYHYFSTRGIPLHVFCLNTGGIPLEYYVVFLGYNYSIIPLEYWIFSLKLSSGIHSLSSGILIVSSGIPLAIPVEFKSF